MQAENVRSSNREVSPLYITVCGKKIFLEQLSFELEWKSANVMNNEIGESEEGKMTFSALFSIFHIWIVVLTRK